MIGNSFLNLPSRRPGRSLKALLNIWLIALVSTLHAGTVTWTGGGADNKWSTPANWNNPPQNGDDLVFTGIIQTTNVNDLDPDLRYFKSITFNAGGFNISGANLRLDKGPAAPMIDDNSGAGANVLNLNVIFAVGQNGTEIHVAAGSSLTIGSVGSTQITIVPTTTFGGTTPDSDMHITADGSLFINSSILAADPVAVPNGTNRFIATGAGLLSLSGASTFRGGLDVATKTLEFGASSSPAGATPVNGPAGTGTVQLHASMTIQSSANVSVGNGFHAQNSFFNMVFAGTHDLTLGSPSQGIDIDSGNGNATFTNTGITTFAGPITRINNNFTKNGPGVLVFSALSPNPGLDGQIPGLVITQGSVRLAINEAWPASVILDPAATFDVNGVTDTIAALKDGTGGGGNVTLNGGTLSVQGEQTVWTGVISGSGNVNVVKGPNTGWGWQTPQTYHGNTSVFGGLAPNIPSVTLKSLAENAVPIDTVLTLGNGASYGIFDLNGHGQTVKGLISSGSNTDNNIGNSAYNLDPPTLTIDVPAGQTYTYAGKLDPLNDKLKLVKDGPGTQILAPVLSHAGNGLADGVTVKAGTLLVNGTIVGQYGTRVTAAVNGAGTLGGTGTVEDVIVTTGGTIAPGDPAVNDGIGIFKARNVDLSAGGTLLLQISGYSLAGSDYDRLDLSGNLVLGGASKLVIDVAGLTTPGIVFDTINAFQGIITGEFSAVQLINNTHDFRVNAIYHGNQYYIDLSPGVGLTLTANPTGIQANGISTSTITAYDFDLNGPVSGKTITFGTDLGTLSQMSAVTGGDGIATVTIKSSTAGTAHVTATDGTNTGNTTVLFVGPPSAGNSTVVAAPATVPADGVTASTITVMLKDASGNPISGTLMTLHAQTGNSVIIPNTATTNANGQATFTVTDTKAESVVYFAQAVIDDVFLTQMPTVTFTPLAVNAFTSTVTAAPTSVQTGGTSTITVTLRDANGNPVSGKSVVLSPTGGSSVVTTVNGVTDANGVATFTVTDAVAEAITYSATDTTDGVVVTQTATVTFTAPQTVSAANSTVVANPLSVPANGTNASTITVTLLDTNGSAVSGKTVTLSAVVGSSVITTVSGTTDANGQAIFTVTDNIVEAVTYSATDTTDNLAITQSATVTFTQNGPTVSISASTPNASETGPVNGIFTVTADSPVANNLTINFNVGGTATSASDYQTIGVSVVIPVNGTNATITVSPVADGLAEPSPETVIVTLSSGAGYAVVNGPGSIATVNISSDDVFALTSEIPASPPNPKVGDTVIFGANANAADAVYTWNFGDGSGTATGATVTHVYSAFGNFNVSVSVTSAAINQMTGAQKQITVKTNVPPLPWSITKLQGSVNFKLPGKDAWTTTGLISGVGAGFSIAGRTTIFDCGGASSTFVVDSKGKKSKNLNGTLQFKLVKNKATQQIDGSLSVKLKGSYQGNWTDEGVTSRTVKKAPVDFIMSLTLDQVFYETVDPVATDYTATMLKSGKFIRRKIQP